MVVKKKDRRWIAEGTLHVEFAVSVRAASPEDVRERLEEFDLVEFTNGLKCDMELNLESVRKVSEQ